MTAYNHRAGAEVSIEFDRTRLNDAEYVSNIIEIAATEFIERIGQAIKLAVEFPDQYVEVRTPTRE